VHQFIATLNPHDATGTHALKLRDALRAAGWRSEIFAEAIHDDLVSEAYKHWMYPEHATSGDVAIYQFTTSSAVAGYLAEHGLPLILDFHNFTGPEYFVGWEPRSVARAAAAAEELALLAPAALLGLAKSPFSRDVLRRAGCRRTEVVPVLADYARVTGGADPRVAAELATLGAAGGVDILFVGRIVPSKAQHELVKALWASMTTRPGCTWSGAPRASSTPRRCGTLSTTSACPPRCDYRARCPTPPWRRTSPPPTPISRCRRTRGSASRS
jgi:glycosyltransferase involved in cell wall biosynthesis